MPTYEYECESCGHRLEAYQSIKAKPLKTCPACEAEGLVRLIGTGGGIIFKGSGFYQTDYRSESYKKGAAAEKPTSSGGDSSKSSDSGSQSTGGKSGGSSSKPEKVA